MDELLEMMRNFADALKNASEKIADTVTQSFVDSVKTSGAVLGQAVASLTPQLALATNQFTQTTASFAALSNALNPWRAVLQSTITAMRPLEQAVANFVTGLRNSSNATDALKAFTAGLVETGASAVISFAAVLKDAPQAALNGFVSSLGQAVSASANMSQMLAGFVQGLTQTVMGPFQALAGAVAPFVQALNPGLMRIFNQALRDLMATFGVAFAPIIQHVTALFNELSATLAPAMYALAPIIDNLMSILEGYLVPALGMVADAFVALSPIIEFATSVVASWMESVRVSMTVWRSVFQVLWDTLKGLFGGVDLKGAAQSLQDVIRQMTKYFVQFAAYVAKALGYLDPFAKALEKNLRDLEGQKPGVKAAPENVHISGLEQISKDLAVAAYAAQAAGGTRKKSEAEFLEELLKALDEIKQGKTLQQLLTELGDTVVTRLIAGFWEDLTRIWNLVVDYLANKAPISSDINRAVQESERGRKLQEQADDIRRRGVPIASNLGGGFWKNFFDQGPGY